MRLTVNCSARNLIRKRIIPFYDQIEPVLREFEKLEIVDVELNICLSDQVIHKEVKIKKCDKAFWIAEVGLPEQTSKSEFTKNGLLELCCIATLAFSFENAAERTRAIKFFEKYINDRKLVGTESQFSKRESEQFSTTLYKQVGDRLSYFEAWITENELECVAHSGIVGAEGEMWTFSSEDRATVRSEQLAALSKAKSDGFQARCESDFVCLKVIYNTSQTWGVSELEQRHGMQALLDDCLKLTGNGFCDGGLAGGGIMAIYNYVVLPNEAQKTISEAIKKANLVQGFRISWYDGSQLSEFSSDQL